MFPVLAQVSVMKSKKRCKLQRKQGPARKRLKRNTEAPLPEVDENIKEVMPENPIELSEELLLQDSDKKHYIKQFFYKSTST